MRRAALGLALSALAACTGAPAPDVGKARGDIVILPPDLPPVSTFAATRATPPARSNTELAADFLELEFQLESGRPLPRFTRFDGPITFALAGDAPANAAGDLGRLLGRLRAEAGLDLTQTTGDAAITLNFLPRQAIRGSDPNVACFVVPGVSTWAEYKSARGSARLDWAELDRRTRVAVFIPSDSSPQELRDCLHEEIAQALGPLNDLYRLSDSVFNDDNFHTVLTGFDMLMLRVHYAPELANGMSKAEVAARLPAILARLNPAGQHTGQASPGPTPQEWTDAMEQALGARGSPQLRQHAAVGALAIARAQGWHDSRLAFSYFALGRVSLALDAQSAIAAFDQAGQIYRSLPGGRIHAAHVDMQLAAFALSRGRSDVAMALADKGIPVVEAAENAALLATFLLIKAEALEMQGRGAEAATLRRESLGWARYGFGSGTDLAERLAAIAALVPDDFRG
jgi:Protein of unknown function (DUF2927)